MATQNRELDGFLSKMPARATRAQMWQRRWFVLRGDTLCFFNTPEDASAGGAAKWTLDLAAHGATATPLGGGEPTRFDLVAGAESFCLKADSEVEAEMIHRIKTYRPPWFTWPPVFFTVHPFGSHCEYVLKYVCSRLIC